MEIFLCEFITGGGLHQVPLPDGLAHEGEIMRRALIHDMHGSGITNIVTTSDYRLARDTDEKRIIGEHDNVWDVWRTIMQKVDAVWPIAPETGGALLRLTELAIDSGCMLYNSMPEGVELTASKYKTYQHLVGHQIPAIETVTVGEPIPDSGDGWILKPDDGVGGENCHYFSKRKALEEGIAALDSKDNYIVQPFTRGTPASLSLLCHQQYGKLIACNRQQFVFHNSQGCLEGIIVNGLSEHWALMEPVAEAIILAVPRLAGYVGVDLVLTESGPLIVEINPRLTTSYVGLGRSLGMNPVAMIMDLFETGRIPAIKPEKTIPVTISLQ